MRTTPCRDPQCPDPTAEGQRIKGKCKTCYQRSYMRERRLAEGGVGTVVQKRYDHLGDPTKWLCENDTEDACEYPASVWFRDEALCKEHAFQALDRAQNDVGWLRYVLRDMRRSPRAQRVHEQNA